eukprot:13206613-Alexandrium_andersonii.AAC.1
MTPGSRGGARSAPFFALDATWPRTGTRALDEASAAQAYRAERKGDNESQYGERTSKAQPTLCTPIPPPEIWCTSAGLPFSH